MLGGKCIVWSQSECMYVGTWNCVRAYVNALSVCVSIISFPPHIHVFAIQFMHAPYSHILARTHTHTRYRDNPPHTFTENNSTHTHTRAQMLRTYMIKCIFWRSFVSLSSGRPAVRPLTSYRPFSLRISPCIPLSNFHALHATALYSNKIASIHYFESIPGHSNTPKCIQ